MKKTLVLFVFLTVLVGIGSTLSAATISGLVTVTRDASRAIVSAVIETNDRDNSGSQVVYNLVMDENGQAIVQQYENNEVKIEGSVSGKDITAETWSRVKQSGSSGSTYSEPEPEPEPEEEEVEETEEGSGEVEEKNPDEDTEEEPTEEEEEEEE
jgi:hypothetical protein